MRRLAVIATALLLGLISTITVAATAFPVKPVRMLVPFPPGGGQDVIGRALAPRLAEALGQQVLIDNRPGGGTVIGAEAAARAAPGDFSAKMRDYTAGNTIRVELARGREWIAAGAAAVARL